jgi:RNA ligase (TIGR02306 family)
MSSFNVQVLPVRNVTDHPNADRLDVATVLGYNCVVAKDVHTTGDLVVYIPEDAILPENVSEELGLGGKLAGSAKNRVKAVRLRGLLSQGVVMPLSVAERLLGRSVSEGEDVAEELGIIKWEPAIPPEMAGQMRRWPTWFDKYTDIENIKKFPETFADGEPVIITEKLHGACMAVALNRDDPTDLHVCSRNINLIESPTNSYWRIARQYDLLGICQSILETTNAHTVAIYGELLGVQDLKYGCTKDVGYRFFDVNVDGVYLDYNSSSLGIAEGEVPIVPILYAGEYSTDVVNSLVGGKSTLADHIREGVVIRGIRERVIMKAISDEYLTRRGGTEFH